MGWLKIADNSVFICNHLDFYFQMDERYFDTVLYMFLPNYTQTSACYMTLKACK